MEKPHDQPAFPRPFSLDDYGDKLDRYKQQDGMTLRQYYAGQALLGMGTWMPSFVKLKVGTYDLQAPEVLAARAEWAVKQADALIAALSPEAP